MDGKKIDKHRWEVWVTLGWFFALAVCAASAYLIYSAGAISIPISNSSGFVTSNQPEVNWFVWLAGIGQSLASLLFAALISIANGSYQQSCENAQKIEAIANTIIADEGKTSLMNDG